MVDRTAYGDHGIAGGGRFGAALLLAAFLVALPVFIPGLLELGENWATPAYSHGPVVAIMALWIGLRALRDEPEALRDLPATPTWPGIVLTMAGLLVGAIGALGKIGDVSAYGLLLWIAGMVFLMLGWARARRLWLSLLLLVFILPLPQFLYWKLTTTLQHVSAVIGVDMIEMMGLTVYLDGNIIDLGVYKLQVAEACSGLQFLFPVISFALLFAAISRSPLWHKVLLIATAPPLAVLMNSARIALTALIVDRRGIESAEGFLHAFEGWTILLVCIVLLAGLMMLLRLVSPGAARRQPLFDLDTHGLMPLLGRAGQLKAPLRLMAMVAAGALASALVLYPAGSGALPTRASFSQFPLEVDGWRGLPNRLDPRIEGVIAADDYIDMTYAARGGEPVNLFAAYYRDQAKGSALHSPEVCLPANGWEVIEFGTRRLDMTRAGFGEFEANRAEIIKGTQRQLVYYWFEQRGTRITNDFVAKIDMLADGILRDRRDGAIVRFVTPIRGDDIEGAEHRIRTMMDKILPELPRYIPQ
jgi:exosortase D (VPLPA-CTERM-specific)